MSLSGWRQFPFFDCLPVRDPNSGSGELLYSDPSVSAICSTPKFLCLACKDATIKLADSSFQAVHVFHAYESDWTITKLVYINGGTNEYLCSIAEAQGRPLYLKLWSLSQLSKKIDYTTDFRSMCQVSNGSNDYPMTCFANSRDFSVLAFGFANGAVILVRGDLLHDRGSRQRVVYQSEEPVTGVEFKDDTLLFVATTSKIVTIATSGRNRGFPERVLDDRQGADMDCSDISDGNQLVVVRNEGLQFYTSRGKGTNLLLEVPKRRLFVQGRYVLMITSNDAASRDSLVASISTYNMVIVDTVDKCIAFSRPIASMVMDVFILWDDIYVYTSDGLLYKLHEKSLAEKLDILVQRELFSSAIKLARDSNDDPVEIMKIQNQYGDYLYSRDEPREAVLQYMECIELGKTSEVIQKYKESSKIPYLAKYLERMVELQKSTEDHVTLLLCCYCKLKQDDKIKQFVESIEVDEDYEIVEADKYKRFDVHAVIDLCRESHYYTLSSQIARKFNLCDVVVDIQLEDLGSPKNAMLYLKSLSIDDLLRVLVDNVKPLLDKLPNDTTQLLIDVFTGIYKPGTEFDEKKQPSNSPSVVEHPMLTSYKQFVSFMKFGEEVGEDAAVSRVSSHSVKEPTYLPPRPRIIFSCFVNHPTEFVIFLEACVESYDKFGGNPKDKKDIQTTLYEMYVTLAKDENEESWHAKAKKLLENIRGSVSEWQLEEKTKLLLLSCVSGFTEGEIMVREGFSDSAASFGMDLFRSTIMSGEFEQSLVILDKYGHREPEMYRLALASYTADEIVYNAVGEERMKSIIGVIQQRKLMTPLEVIKQLGLSNRGFVKLGLVKPYLLDYIQKQKREIDNSNKLIDSYRKDTRGVEKELSELLQESQTVNRARCSSCKQPLVFPLVHFKCGHSFHEHCLMASSQVVESSYACPLCSDEYDALTVLKRQQETVSRQNEMFQASLEGSNDRFKVMMGFIGRGALREMGTDVYRKADLDDI